MTDETRRSADAVTERLSSALASRADELGERWLALVRERRSVRPADELPEALLREAMPAVIRALARSLVEPVHLDSDGELPRLRDVARARSDAGVDVQELIGEVEQLGHLLFSTAADVIDTPQGAEISDATIALTKLHDALARLSTLIAGMQREVEAMAQRRLAADLREFGRKVAHDIKNPISSAQGAAQLLQEDAIAADGDQRRHFVDIVLRNLEKATKLTEQIRALSRLETPELMRTRGRATLRRVLERVQSDVAAEAESRSVAIEVRGDVPDIHVDERRTTLALLNLVRNAVHSANGDVAGRHARIGVTWSSEQESWRIAVTDNGIAVPETAPDDVFGRFSRARAADDGSAGLGLAVARDAVEEMGGEIGFESEEGAGTTFWFTIPEHATAQTSAADAASDQ